MLKINPEVLWYDLEGELVLLNTSTGRYLGLNAIGGFIFRAIASNQTKPELVAALTTRYEVESQVADAEVERLLAELRTAKVLLDA